MKDSYVIFIIAYCLLPSERTLPYRRVEYILLLIIIVDVYHINMLLIQCKFDP